MTGGGRGMVAPTQAVVAQERRVAERQRYPSVKMRLPPSSKKAVKANQVESARPHMGGRRVLEQWRSPFNKNEAPYTTL